MGRKILLIEDNPDICRMLAEALSGAGYSVDAAYTGTDGVGRFLRQAFDLVLLDIMLSLKSGDEVLRAIRERSDVPVIVLSAKSRVETKVDFLRLGADDYVTKPFDLEEVIARVEAHLRRRAAGNGLPERLLYKDVALYGQEKRVSVGAREVELTATEFRLLALLMENRNKVFTRANLYETLWGGDYLGDDNAVKTHVSNLRAKLKAANPDEEYIETVWGLGYRLYRE